MATPKSLVGVVDDALRWVSDRDLDRILTLVAEELVRRKIRGVLYDRTE